MPMQNSQTAEIAAAEKIEDGARPCVGGKIWVQPAR